MTEPNETIGTATTEPERHEYEKSNVVDMCGHLTQTSVNTGYFCGLPADHPVHQPATSSGDTETAAECPFTGAEWHIGLACTDAHTSSGQTAEHEIDTARMRACAPLLPPPGDEVVRDLCDALDRQQEETERLQAEAEEDAAEYLRDMNHSTRCYDEMKAQRDDARARLAEIQRRCQLRIDMVRAQNPDNEYNPNTRPAWILVEDVLNVITPSRKYSQE